LNATSGAYIWSYTTSSWVASSPAVADGKVYVGDGNGAVYCLNATNGALIWNYATGDCVDSSPAVADGKVYVGSFDGKVYCFGLPLQDTMLTFSLSPNPAIVGQTVVLQGSLKDEFSQPLNNTQVSIYVGGSFAANLYTNASGWFKASAPVTSPGTFIVNVTYAGNVTYNPSWHAEILTVYQKWPTNVTFTFSPNPAKVGQFVTLRGNLTSVFGSPIGKAPLELWLKIGTTPWQYLANLSTNSTGWFQASGQTTIPGIYQAAVVYRGTSQYDMSYHIETLIVNP
jgi:hypothetical protein